MGSHGCSVAHSSIRTDKVINGNELTDRWFCLSLSLSHAHKHTNMQYWCFHSVRSVSDFLEGSLSLFLSIILSAKVMLEVREKYLAPLTSEHIN